jgi:LysM repeat protein
MKRNLALAALVLLGVAAACTRPAPTSTVATPTTGAGTLGPVETDPTMAAVGTDIAGRLTATAIAQGSGGGEVLPDQATATSLAPVATQTPSAPVATATPITAGCANPYTVKQGDWIYKIARECRVEPSAIIALNPIINPNFIVPGQQLNMPAAGATAVPPATPQACTGTHTVVRGENLFRIAYNCGFTTEELALFNGIAFPYVIHPGDVVRFP